MMATDEIIFQKAGGVRTIILNNPKKKNAISVPMFQLLADTFNKDAEDDEIIMTIMTGKGDYFTSGFQIGNIQFDSDPSPILDESVQCFKNFATAVINYPKLFVVLVNGPAVGVGVTLLGLADVAYATDNATFKTPFTTLGICPEACSSYLFPRMFGRSMASELLLMSRSITAEEALRIGLISKIVPKEKLEETYETLKGYGEKLPKETLKNNKALMLYNLKSILLKVNDEECVALRSRFESEDFLTNMMAFLTRKSKL